MEEIKETEWLCADTLKQKYIVYGSFYNIIIKDSCIKCRNSLEIYIKLGNFDSALQLQPFSYSPDAIFIMMNPGSSRPEDENCEPLDCMIDEIKENCLVEAKPDVTQYQVMRVMNYKKWNHVRILNLSDMREPKSSVFYQKCATFNNEEYIHSIFSDKRLEELKRALNVTPDVPFVLAWGADKHLLELSQNCFTQLKNINIKNINFSVRSDTLPETLCYHASPTLDKKKKEWLSEICRKI